MLSDRYDCIDERGIGPATALTRSQISITPSDAGASSSTLRMASRTCPGALRASSFSMEVEYRRRDVFFPPAGRIPEGLPDEIVFGVGYAMWRRESDAKLEIAL